LSAKSTAERHDVIPVFFLNKEPIGHLARASNVSVSVVGKLTAGGSVTVSFTIKKNAKHGTYAITFNGKTKNLMASAVYTLTI